MGWRGEGKGSQMHCRDEQKRNSVAGLAVSRQQEYLSVAAVASVSLFAVQADRQKLGGGPEHVFEL